jgi:glutaredoxin
MRSSWLAVALSLSVSLAHAQFKWVDDSGRIGYGDKPPPGAHDIEALEGVAKGTKTDPLAELPYELQRTVKDFPVTLYVTKDCSGCDKGRALLKQRSVPFSERTILRAEDVLELKRLSGSDQLPVLQVGSRRLTGFSSAMWTEMLDSAGYPHERLLPANWVWAAPKPLAEDSPAQTAAAQNAAPPNAGNPQ